MEYARRGKFERLYPREDSFLYNSFFHEQRRNNILATNYMFKQSTDETDISKLVAIQRKITTKSGVTNKISFNKKK